jgi:hypothetical protein
MVWPVKSLTADSEFCILATRSSSPATEIEE